MKFNTQEKKPRTSNSNMIKITFIFFFVNSLISQLHSTSAKILNDLDSRTKNQ